MSLFLPSCRSVLSPPAEQAWVGGEWVPWCSLASCTFTRWQPGGQPGGGRRAECFNEGLESWVCRYCQFLPCDGDPTRGLTGTLFLRTRPGQLGQGPHDPGTAQPSGASCLLAMCVTWSLWRPLQLRVGMGVLKALWWLFWQQDLDPFFTKGSWARHGRMPVSVWAPGCH